MMPLKRLLLASVFITLGTPLAAASESGSTAIPELVFASPPATAFDQPLGDVDGSTPLRVVLSLPLADESAAEQFARDVSDPHSANYGKFLTPAEFAARFGANSENYAAVVGWAKANGLNVGAQTNSRSTISVAAPAGVIEKLFATRIATYRTLRGEKVFTTTVLPTLPAELANRVDGVIGLSAAVRFAPLLQNAAVGGPRPDNAGGTGVLGAYAPADLRAAYNIPPQLTNSITETVAVFEQGGFFKSDVAVFEAKYKLPDTPVVVREVNGYKGAVNNYDIEEESVLDIDTLIGINPKIKRVVDYEEGDDPFAVALVDSLAAMADDDIAQTISISYGTAESFQGVPTLKAEHRLLVQMAAQGQTVYASAGDNGAYADYSTLSVEDPAAQPYVTAVGGTTLYTGPKEVYLAEDVWNLLGQYLGATGGGVSSYWAIPEFQLENGTSIATGNGGSATLRNVPDVAADASPATGASIYSKLNGGWLQVGGTSLAAPVWAGYSSIMNSARKGAGLAPLGFYNPIAYYLGEHSYGQNDITYGNNGDLGSYGVAGFNAGRGYDNVSGWGSVNGNVYAFNLLISNVAKGKPPGVVHGITAKATATSVTLRWTAGANSTGYVTEVSPASNVLIAYNSVTTGTSVTVAGLKSGTTYLAFVNSVNHSGNAFGGPVIFSTP